MQLKTIVLSPEIYVNLTSISEKWYPEECCALLFGEIGETRYHITKVSEMINFVHSATEFRIDEMELYSTVSQYETSNQKLLGIFHSHPETAYLSVFDKTTIIHIAKMYPHWVWLVYGNLSHGLKAYFLTCFNKFIEISIRS
jgi:proteasome lid subunit RPN8/RPN11